MIRLPPFSSDSMDVPVLEPTPQNFLAAASPHAACHLLRVSESRPRDSNILLESSTHSHSYYVGHAKMPASCTHLLVTFVLTRPCAYVQ